MAEEDNRACPGCGAEPGERHRHTDNIARCRSTGQQLIQCEGELHKFNGRWYGEHKGPCGPDTWDGEYPGIKACRKYNLYTEPGSIWGVTEDLNRLYSNCSWNAETEEFEYHG